MSPEEFLSQVTIQIFPEEPVEHTPEGWIAGGQIFFLRTCGMDKLDRPNLEMRGVPGPFVGAAGDYLNHWGYHSATGKEIQAGDRIQDDDGPFPVIFQATPSKDHGYLRLESIGFAAAAMNTVH